jgi:hypothetical protein
MGAVQQGARREEGALFRSEAWDVVLGVGVVALGAALACSDPAGEPAWVEPDQTPSQGAEPDQPDGSTEGSAHSPDPPTALPQRSAGSIQLRCLGDCSLSEIAKAAPAGDSGRDIGRHDQALSATPTFAMGDLNASREFLFLLVNPGDTDVTDIRLSTSNPSFSIEPTTIDRLPAQEDAVILPIIRVLAEHGTSFKGVGSIPLLPMGLHETTLEISGTSTNEAGEAAATEASAVIEFTARVMDVELLDGDAPIDLATPTGSSSSTLGGLGFVNLYYAAVPRLVNTGNVDIEVTLSFAGGPSVFASTLEVGATLDLVPQGGGYTGVGLQSNTVADGSRFQIGNDGAAYFLLNSELDF